MSVYRLQQHFVQRRRADVEEDEWQAAKAFPKHFEDERTFTLTGDWAKFQEDVLDYCVGLTESAGDNAQRRRMAFWSTLALMRCIGSSPAAAHQALTNRLAGLGEEKEIQAPGAMSPPSHSLNVMRSTKGCAGLTNSPCRSPRFPSSASRTSWPRSAPPNVTP